jgi:hypothetical protein
MQCSSSNNSSTSTSTSKHTSRAAKLSCYGMACTRFCYTVAACLLLSAVCCLLSAVCCLLFAVAGDFAIWDIDITTEQLLDAQINK